MINGIINIIMNELIVSDSCVSAYINVGSKLLESKQLGHFHSLAKSSSLVFLIYI